jgi:hypothetical protein
LDNPFFDVDLGAVDLLHMVINYNSRPLLLIRMRWLVLLPRQYKKDDYWSVTNAAYAKGRATMASNSLKNMMDMVKRVLPRKEGNGWDVQKFHEMFPLIHDMTRFGAPMNSDSGAGKN